MSTANKVVNIDVSEGEVIVNSAYMEAEADRVAAISVDCTTKRPVIGAYCSSSDGKPSIMLHVDEYSLHTNNGYKGIATEVSFRDFVGWTVWSASVGRYTVYVCLVKDD